VVAERVAIAVVAEPDGSWRLIDAEGRAFGTATVPPAGAVRVAGELGRGLDDGQLRAAAAVAASLPGDLAGQVTAVDPKSADDVRLALIGGAEVRWGSPADPAAKAAILRVLIQRPAEVYDVSTPRTPTTS
jgi:cell division protein FtsQ